MRIRFLSDQVYETGGPNKGPRFAKGFVLDSSGVSDALGLRHAPDEAWIEGFLNRWTQRGAAEEVGDDVPVGMPSADDGEHGYDAKTVAELRKFAEERKIDLGDATRKADIIAAIELADEAEKSE